MRSAQSSGRYCTRVSVSFPLFGGSKQLRPGAIRPQGRYITSSIPPLLFFSTNTLFHLLESKRHTVWTHEVCQHHTRIHPCSCHVLPLFQKIEALENGLLSPSSLLERPEASWVSPHGLYLPSTVCHKSSLVLGRSFYLYKKGHRTSYVLLLLDLKSTIHGYCAECGVSYTQIDRSPFYGRWRGARYFGGIHASIHHSYILKVDRKCSAIFQNQGGRHHVFREFLMT